MKEMYGVKIRLRDDGLWYWREWFDTSDEAVSLLGRPSRRGVN